MGGTYNVNLITMYLYICSLGFYECLLVLLMINAVNGHWRISIIAYYNLDSLNVPGKYIISLCSVVDTLLTSTFQTWPRKWFLQPQSQSCPWHFVLKYKKPESKSPFTKCPKWSPDTNPPWIFPGKFVFGCYE